METPGDGDRFLSTNAVCKVQFGHYDASYLPRKFHGYFMIANEVVKCKNHVCSISHQYVHYCEEHKLFLQSILKIETLFSRHCMLFLEMALYSTIALNIWVVLAYTALYTSFLMI